MDITIFIFCLFMGSLIGLATLMGDGSRFLTVIIHRIVQSIRVLFYADPLDSC
jgi:hypothetical protein